MNPITALDRPPALRLHDLPVPGGRLFFTARAGEVVLLRGASPEAQLRLLAIAAGHAFGGPGRCLIDGEGTRSLDRDGLAALRRRSTARVLRFDRLAPGRSLLAATADAALQRGIAPSEALHRAAVELDQLGLTDRMTDSTSSLTPTEARLVLLARARACRPVVLVAEHLDEGMQAAERTLLRSALAGAAEQGSCVLMTAGHPSFAAIATRHLYIGHVMAEAA